MASRLVLGVTFVLDLIAFALAVAAEQRRSTVSSSVTFYSSIITCWVHIGALASVLSVGFDADLGIGAV